MCSNREKRISKLYKLPLLAWNSLSIAHTILERMSSSSPTKIEKRWSSMPRRLNSRVNLWTHRLSLIMMTEQIGLLTITQREEAETKTWFTRWAPQSRPHLTLKSMTRPLRITWLRCRRWTRALKSRAVAQLTPHLEVMSDSRQLRTAISTKVDRPSIVRKTLNYWRIITSFTRGPLMQLEMAEIAQPAWPLLRRASWLNRDCRTKGWTFSRDVATRNSWVSKIQIESLAMLLVMTHLPWEVEIWPEKSKIEATPLTINLLKGNSQTSGWRQMLKIRTRGVSFTRTNLTMDTIQMAGIAPLQWIDKSWHPKKREPVSKVKEKSIKSEVNSKTLRFLALASSLILRQRRSEIRLTDLSKTRLTRISSKGRIFPLRLSEIRSVTHRGQNWQL